MNKYLSAIQNYIAQASDELKALSQDLYNNPEMGNQEFHAAKIESDFLEKHGFKVTREFGGCPTAFCGEFGYGSPRVAIFSEFDALPIGHACGHHLISLSALAAAVAVKNMIADHSFTGSVVLVGSPAEEALGGKIDLLRAGVLDDIDFALISHPYNTTNIDHGNLAVGRYDVIFKGRAAHAAVSPEEGINALDAQNLMFNGISFWRQQMPNNSRVHGVITNGGLMPNIIPDYSSSFFYVRSLDNETQAQLEARFERIAAGAAMMTDCELELRKYPNSYSANKSIPELDELMRAGAVTAGFELGEINQKISTDFADVTLKCPGVNLMFDVVGTGCAVPLHSQEFLEWGNKPFAYEQALRAGSATALVAVELLTNAEVAKSITDSFKNS